MTPKEISPVRFCEAVSMARTCDMALSPDDICCNGAKRCFGWLKNIDMELARKLAEKTGITQTLALKMIKNVPVQNEPFAGLSLGSHADGDVYISYASPESAMKLVRHWQKTTGCNLETDISSILSVCGNVAVKSFITHKISISYGCPDSRKYGGIEQGQLVMGIPHKLASEICMIHGVIDTR
ncbi:MAG: DUF169 domain-containing protein [Sedimentisphaerales bacterium]|nr:DUF169 domain-containing protein [Sedimentisphaerales bacterium]